ncbi:conserved hypothetical protein [Methanosalsum zhilinae DSM 4017]|uniref:Uncharacterized protein n=1 Tax=Methanosalsum zhilinae (strain DSM 4017 / NBRC 107636 / OCM 62 / WeN5) TaxID=679901 RepID=F7XKH2_METZD|nr:hypothetical protein [Methanosalsum zhilinae]AEH61746.1 conserved hypothetical protein [Methanosalsum zhilinae DSM 4017]
MDKEYRKINVDIERNRVRIVITHGEDEEILKLTIDQADQLSQDLRGVLEDYHQRKNVRID